LKFNLLTIQKNRIVFLGLALILITLNARALVSQGTILSTFMTIFSCTYFVIGNIFLARDTLYGLLRMERLQSSIIMLMLCLVSIAIIRSFMVGTITLAEFVISIVNYPLVMLFIIGSYLYFYYQNKTKQYLMATFSSLLLYVVANFILHFIVGGSSQTGYSYTGETVMLSLFGFTTNRVFFPMAPGINSFGSIAGVAFAISLMIWFSNLKIRNSLLVAVSLACILLVDARTALFMSSFAVLLTMLFWRWRRKAVFIPVLIPFIYLLLPLANIIIQATPFADRLLRNSTDAMTLGGRAIIWMSLLSEVAQFKWVHLIGYGMYGQQTSEISSNYVQIFVDYLTDKPERMSLHSGYFQNIIDFGYVGLLFIISVNSLLIRRITLCTDERSAKVMLCAVLCMLLIGITEPVPTIYSRELFYVYFMLLVAGLGMKRNKEIEE